MKDSTLHVDNMTQDQAMEVLRSYPVGTFLVSKEENKNLFCVKKISNKKFQREAFQCVSCIRASTYEEALEKGAIKPEWLKQDDKGKEAFKSYTDADMIKDIYDAMYKEANAIHYLAYENIISFLHATNKKNNNEPGPCWKFRMHLGEFYLSCEILSSDLTKKQWSREEIQYLQNNTTFGLNKPEVVDEMQKNNLTAVLTSHFKKLFNDQVFILEDFLKNLTDRIEFLDEISTITIDDRIAAALKNEPDKKAKRKYMYYECLKHDVKSEKPELPEIKYTIGLRMDDVLRKKLLSLCDNHLTPLTKLCLFVVNKAKKAGVITPDTAQEGLIQEIQNRFN